MMTELLFIRHGQTSANAAGRWEGWSDSPLTSLGELEAEAVAHRLSSEHSKIAALYTSPLRRARQTAHILGAKLGREPVSVEYLKEIDFGELNGITLEEMESQYPRLFSRWRDKTNMRFQWPGGERRADFFHRVALTCDRILASHPEDRVAIVAHGGTLRASLAHLLPQQLGRWWTYSLDNCGLTHVSVTAGQARLIVLNDNAHLPPAETRAGFT